jgi:hypothetical protein
MLFQNRFQAILLENNPAHIGYGVFNAHRNQRRRVFLYVGQDQSGGESNHRPADDFFLFEACCLMSSRACSNLGVGPNLVGFLRSFSMVTEKVLASCPVRTGVAAMGNAIAYLLCTFYRHVRVFICMLNASTHLLRFNHIVKNTVKYKQGKFVLYQRIRSLSYRCNMKFINAVTRFPHLSPKIVAHTHNSEKK